MERVDELSVPQSVRVNLSRDLEAYWPMGRRLTNIMSGMSLVLGSI